MPYNEQSTKMLKSAGLEGCALEFKAEIADCLDELESNPNTMGGCAEGKAY
jgi:hypothetical protein